MFCKNCGTQFPDGQAFCPECGTAVQSVAPVNEVQQTVDNTVNEAANVANEAAGAVNEAAAGAYDAASGAYNEAAGAYNAAAGDYSYNTTPKAPMSAEAKKKLFKWIGIGAGAVLVLIILIVALHSSPKKTVKKYLKAFEKGNTKKMALCVLPKKSADTYTDKLYNMDAKEYYGYMDDASEALIKGLKSEKYKLKVDYEIKEVEKLGKLDKLDKEVRNKYGLKDDLDDFKDNKTLSKMLDKYYDIDIDKVKGVAAVKVKIKVNLGKEKFYSDTVLFLTFKYKGKWYILGAEGDENTQLFDEPLPDGAYSNLASAISNYDDKDVRTDLKDVVKDFNTEYKNFTKAASKSKSSSGKYDDDDDDDYKDYLDDAEDYLDGYDW